MRRYIFTEHERRLLEAWIENAEENQQTKNILSWIRQGWPRLADDMTLLFKTIRTMMRRKRWRGYVTRGSEFGLALHRVEYALTRVRNV